MKKQEFNVTMFSTALFATWIFVEDLSLLIDAGDGLTAGLLQKARKVKFAFITHADRDHITGLPQFLQLNARDGFPKVYYPKDAGSFLAMRNFLQDFDPHVAQTPWEGLADKDMVRFKAGYEMKAVKNGHIPIIEEEMKSCGYQLFSTKRKLKKELVGRPAREIQELSKKFGGSSAITDQVSEKLIGFSGDTPIGNYELWDGFKTLFHEATFLKDDVKTSHIAKHSTLEEVIRMASEIDIERLVLSHFSTRYSETQIAEAVDLLLKEYRLNIPVHVVYPGEIAQDILNAPAFNA